MAGLSTQKFVECSIFYGEGNATVDGSPRALRGPGASQRGAAGGALGPLSTTRRRASTPQSRSSEPRMLGPNAARGAAPPPGWVIRTAARRRSPRAGACRIPSASPGSWEITTLRTSSPGKTTHSTAMQSNLGAARKLRPDALTLENTVPLKLKVKLAATGTPSKALPYTTCFNVGDWYYTGPEKPGSPPSDGVPTCVVSNSIATSLNADPCWGKCREDDVLTPDLAAFFRTSLDAAVEAGESDPRPRAGFPSHP